MYGWRARIGVLIPTNNTVIEPEFGMWSAEGVTFHFTRMISSRSGHGSIEGLRHLVTNVDRAVEELSITGVQMMLYGCLSTSLAIPGWEKSFLEKVKKWSSIPAQTAFGATCAGLKAFSAEKIAILCPYGEELQRLAREAFSKHGFNVKALTSLNITGLRSVCNVAPEKVYTAAVEMEKGDAEALCILATDLPTFPVLKKIEEDSGLPVISSNQALLWAAESVTKTVKKNTEYGSLFVKRYF